MNIAKCSLLSFVAIFLLLPVLIAPGQLAESGHQEIDSRVTKLIHESFGIWLGNTSLDNAKPEFELLFRFGLLDAAVENIDRAVEAGLGERMLPPMYTTIRKYLQNDQHERAMELAIRWAQEVPKDANAIRFLEAIAHYHLQRHESMQAHEVIDLIESELLSTGDRQLATRIRDRLNRMVADIYIQEGNCDAAWNWLKETHGGELPEAEQKELLDEAHRAGQFDWLLEKVLAMPDELLKVKRLRNMVDSAIRKRHWRTAVRLNEELDKLGSPKARINLAHIVKGCGDREITTPLLGKLSLEGRSGWYGATALISVYLLDGEIEKALDVVATQSKTGVMFRTDTTASIADALLTRYLGGQKKDAVRIIESIEPDWLSVFVRAEIGRKLLPTDERSYAKELLQQVEREIFDLENIEQFSLHSVCRTMAESGNIDSAIRLMEMELKSDSGMPVFREVPLQLDIARQLLQNDEVERCRKLFLEFPIAFRDAPGKQHRDVLTDFARKAGIDGLIKMISRNTLSQYSLYPELLVDFVSNGDIELAEEFWQARMGMLNGEEELRRLAGPTLTVVFSSLRSRDHSVETLRTLEQIIGTENVLPDQLPKAYANLGWIEDSLRLAAEMDVRADRRMQGVFQCLAKVGEIPVLLEHPVSQNDPGFLEVQDYYRAGHQVTVGNTERAIELAADLPDHWRKRDLLRRCAEQLGSPWLESLRKIDNWIQSTVDLDTSTHSTDLYGGLPGLSLFYEKMYAVTGEQIYRVRQLRIERLLIARLKNSDFPELDRGLFFGPTGGIYSLFGKLGGRVSFSGDYRPETEALWTIQRWVELCESTSEASKLRENREPDRALGVLDGDAGIGLVLLKNWQNGLWDGRGWNSLDAATRIGDNLLRNAETVTLQDGQVALRWRRSLGSGEEHPGYALGTAGIVDFLLQLDRYMGYNLRSGYDGRFGEAVVAGVRYLKALDEQHGEPGLLPKHLTEDQPGEFVFSWMHGVAGTCQLANRLAKLQESDEWNAFSRSATDQILLAESRDGIDQLAGKGVGLGNGAAGIGSFLLDQGKRFENTGYKAAAHRIAHHILVRGVEGSTENGLTTLHWPKPGDTESAEAESPFGLMDGAAGVGLFLLQMEAVKRDRKAFSIFEDVFP